MKLQDCISPGFKIDTIVHVGAHLGQELNYYLSLDPQKIVYIEGDPIVFKELKRMVEEKSLNNKVVVLNSLVSSTDHCRVSFKIYNNYRGSSSIYNPNRTMNILYPGLEPTGEEIEMLTARLDTLLEKNHISPSSVDILIFDIQGAEYLALLGSGRYLINPYFIEVEVSSSPIYEGAPSFSDINLLMKSLQYSMIGRVVPAHGDVVYYNKKKLLNK